jgi:hypothetical protein
VIPAKWMQVCLECSAWVCDDAVYLKNDDGTFVARVVDGRLVPDPESTKWESPWVRCLAFDGEDD